LAGLIFPPLRYAIEVQTPPKAAVVIVPDIWPDGACDEATALIEARTGQRATVLAVHTLNPALILLGIREKDE
jgi:hypothetical protein